MDSRHKGVVDSDSADVLQSFLTSRPLIYALKAITKLKHDSHGIPSAGITATQYHSIDTWQAQKNPLWKRAARKLIDVMEKMEYEFDPGEGTVIKAIKSGDVRKLKDLLKAKRIDPDRGAGARTTLLMETLNWCPRSRLGDMVDALLTSGAKVDATDDNLTTPLIYASAIGLTDIVKKLLAKGADPNLHSKSGYTALMGAARGGYIEIARMLLASGADINAKDEQGMTALARAIEGRNAEMVKFLLENGASKDAKFSSYYEKPPAWDIYRLADLIGDKRILDLLGHRAAAEASPVQLRSESVGEMSRPVMKSRAGI